MAFGKVWLVGGGPGDAGLFTIKGKQILEEAEVVVYDRLVGQGVLSMMPKSALCIDVGKKAGHHKMPQEEVNQLLLDKALEGKRVVRLKGGDPFLFGRGGEELELLQEFNIPFEIVPGITSAISVPAYNGIPVTHRDYCSSLHIVTGHKKKDEDYDIDFEALVRTKGTLVFLMGLSALEAICKHLIKYGMDENTPAAVLQQGTTANQRRVVGTLNNLKEKTEEAGIITPAIIVVGDVCKLEQEFGWYEKMPLSGYKIAITRPKELVSKMALLLRKEGAEVIELPSIATQSIDNQQIAEIFANLSSYQWIAFTSPSGVRIFFDHTKTYGLDIRSLYGIKIAAIGSGTKKELEDRGILVDFVPTEYNGETFGIELGAFCEDGAKILLPRSKEGNYKIVEGLCNAGLQVTDLGIYETVYECPQIFKENDAFEKAMVDCVVFTSASTVKGFVKAFSHLDFSKVKAACIGTLTQEEALKYGMNTFVSEHATIESLAELVKAIKNT